MSAESAQKFYDDISSGKLTLDVSKLKDSDLSSRLLYFSSLGYDFSPDEMIETLRQNGQSMTMEEAEAVVGGMTTTEANNIGAEATVGVGVVGAAVAVAFA